MRRIRRLRATIHSLEQFENAIIQEYLAVPTEFKPVYRSNRWRTSEILGSLLASHGRSCAYCQGTLTQSDRGDVEHFRPKSHYWWLTYNIRNYLISCARCNRVRKGDRFPLADGVPNYDFSRRSELKEEPRLLADPYTDEVERLYGAVVDDTLILVLPLVTTSDDDNSMRISEYTKDFFDFNTNGLLVKERTDTVFKALGAMKRLRQGDLTAETDITRLANRYSPHGIAVRQILMPKYDAQLPSEAAQVDWFVDDTIVEMKMLDRIIAVNTNAKDARFLKEINGWALATLWHNSPADNLEAIERKLNNENYSDYVEQFQRLLS